MKVSIAESAQIVLRNLRDDDRRNVWVWIDNLKRWEADSFVRENSKRLDLTDNVYMLVTNSDFRIFFRLEDDRITVEDVATKSMIASFGPNSEAE